MENVENGNQNLTPGIVVVKGPQANWLPVHLDPEAAAACDVELDVNTRTIKST
jgi:hypothetical protein